MRNVLRFSIRSFPVNRTSHLKTQLALTSNFFHVIIKEPLIFRTRSLSLEKKRRTSRSRRGVTSVRRMSKCGRQNYHYYYCCYYYLLHSFIIIVVISMFILSICRYLIKQIFPSLNVVVTDQNVRSIMRGTSKRHRQRWQGRY